MSLTTKVIPFRFTQSREAVPSWDKELNYELQVKVSLNDRNKGLTALNTISKGLEELETLESADGSFKFKKIKVSSDPYLMDVTNDNNIYFRFTFVVSVNIKPKGEI